MRRAGPLAVALTLAAPVAAAQPGVGLFEHVDAANVDAPEFRARLPGLDLVVVRGARSQAPRVEDLQAGGRRQVLLYWRTALPKAEADGLAAAHPQLLAHDGTGSLVTSRGPGTVLLDITRPDTRQWIVDQLQPVFRAGGYDGVFFDTLGAYFPPRFYSAQPVEPSGPVTDAQWRDASVALVRAVKAATGKPVVANGFGLGTGKAYLAHRRDVDMLIDAADGIQIEGFTRWGKTKEGRFRPSQSWTDDVRLLSSAAGRGKIVLALTRISSSVTTADIDRVRTFAFASFLLGAGGRSFFFFQAPGRETDLEPVLRSLGPARSAERESGGTFLRLFQRGVVAVNPGGESRRVSLEGRALPLPPRSARIELGATGAAVPGEGGAARSGLPPWAVVLAGVAGGGLLAAGVAGARRRRRA